MSMTKAFYHFQYFIVKVAVQIEDLKKTLNPLSAKLTKWPSALKQFVGNLPTNCLSVFGHFVRLALKRLKKNSEETLRNYKKDKQSSGVLYKTEQACNFIKKEVLAQVLSNEFCEIFKNTFFYRTPPVATSG